MPAGPHVSQFTQRMSRRTLCGALAAIGFGVKPVAALPRLITLAELVRKASGVYVARPKQRTAVWETVFGAPRIVSTFEADVEQTLVGERVRSKLAIRELGGQVGDLVQRVAHAATLSVGRPCLVFLTPEVNSTGRYWVLGMEQGCYPLRPTEEDYQVGLLPEQRALLDVPNSVAESLNGQRVSQVKAELQRLLRC